MEEKTQEKRKSELNLKYIVGTPKRPSFFWPLFFGASLFLGFCFWGLWVIDVKQEPSVIHRIQEGQTLRILATIYYEDPGQWRRIFLANRDKFPKGGGTLKPGVVLRIPLTKEEKEKLIARIKSQQNSRE